jgi:hypothetical protein
MILAKHIFDDITRNHGGCIELASSNLTFLSGNSRPSTPSVSLVESYQNAIPLGINQSKGELLKYLGMDENVYCQMAVSSLYTM